LRRGWMRRSGSCMMVESRGALRPKLVKAVFGYVGAHEFERGDFLVFTHKITAERNVRLAPGLAKEIVTLALRTISMRECVRMVEWLKRSL
jgi:hypothetical protein